MVSTPDRFSFVWGYNIAHFDTMREGERGLNRGIFLRIFGSTVRDSFCCRPVSINGMSISSSCICWNQKQTSPLSFLRQLYESNPMCVIPPQVKSLLPRCHYASPPSSSHKENTPRLLRESFSLSLSKPLTITFLQ